MKYYILLTPGIMDIGGAQMYTRNKMRYLTEMGYNVSIFHSGTGKGQIMIKEFLDYKSNYDHHILYPAYLFRKRVREQVLSLIFAKLTIDATDLIIESHSVACATWGEIIAEKIKAKHIVFLLSEYNSIRNADMYRFFKFKLDRNELVGIAKTTIPVLFRKWEVLAHNESFFLNASCTNVVENIKYSMLNDIPENDYIIGSIGRLNKLFVNHMLDDVIDFVKRQGDKKFTILFIGGEPRESQNKNVIEQKFKTIKNVDLFFTDYLYPIPRELVLKPDVFVSSAGSCIVSSSLGVPTISIDAYDYKPIGILGHTTNNPLFREKEVQLSLQELLYDVLIRKIYKKKNNNSTIQNQLEFSEHLHFLNNSEKSIKYYSFVNCKYSLIDWIEKFSLFFLGDQLLRKISMKLMPIWNSIKM